MKKRFLMSVLIVAVAVGGYLTNLYDTKSSYGFIRKVEDIPAQILQADKEGLAPGKYIDAYVVKATDGDTFEVSYKKQVYKVRLLDVDTPESVKQGVTVQPYGKEASEFTKSMALNKPVKLVFEKGIRDKYGRLLAYAFLKDGTFLNAVLVRNGYARVEIVSPNKAHADYFYKLQQQAIADKLGVWSLPVDKQPFVKDGSGEFIPRYWQQEKAS